MVRARNGVEVMMVLNALCPLYMNPISGVVTSMSLVLFKQLIVNDFTIVMDQMTQSYMTP